MMFCLRYIRFLTTVRFTTIYTKTKSLTPCYIARACFDLAFVILCVTLNAGGCAILIVSIGVKHVHFNTTFVEKLDILLQFLFEKKKTVCALLVALVEYE